MPLRRCSFAITTEMREEAQRYDIDFKDADLITLLAAPLVCADFQHDFGIVSGAVFEDIGAVIHQERWHTGKEFLSLHGTPNIRSEMGHRLNDLPFFRLVPDRFVVDNNLKRIHHHTLMPYKGAEWFDRTIAVLFTDHLRWTPEITNATRTGTFIILRAESLTLLNQMTLVCLGSQIITVVVTTSTIAPWMLYLFNG